MLRLALIILLFLGPFEVRAGTITVYAAASLKEALEEVSARFEADTGTKVVLSLAGSSALARQIELGAPADVFLSANPGWMDVLEGRELLVPGTRRALLSNRLVLVGPAPQDPVPDLSALDFDAALGGGRLATALVDAVPAGIYARQALTALGLWDALAPRIAQADNVRAALALVSTGAAPLGIVYATDALADPRVAVIASFPPESHDPITYPVALIRDHAPGAEAFMSFLDTPGAGEIFRKAGFDVLPSD